MSYNNSNLFKNKFISGGNNEKFYYSAKREKKDISRKIRDIFNDPSFVYKANCKITINNQEYDKVIVAYKDDYLLTISGEKINVHDIDDIKKGF